MIKLNTVNSLLGNVYPFFLSNNNLTTDPSYYLYQVVTPGLSEDLIPYVSLHKVSEKTKTGSPKEPFGHGDIDIINAALGGKGKGGDKAIQYIKSFFYKNEPIIDHPEKPTDFPLIEMENGNSIQKTLIIRLREALRWNNYNLLPGHYVDVLWGKNIFMIFKLEGTKTEVWLSPVSLYSNLDPGQKNPLSIDLEKINYPKDHWKLDEKSNKIPALTQAIKKLELASFYGAPGKEMIIEGNEEIINA